MEACWKAYTEPSYLSQLSVLNTIPSLLGAQVTGVQVAPKGCASWSVSLEAPLSLPQPQHSSLLEGFQQPRLTPWASSASQALSQIYPHCIPLHPFEVLTQILSSLQSHPDLSFKNYTSPCLEFFPAFVFSIACSLFNSLFYLFIVWTSPSNTKT